MPTASLALAAISLATWITACGPRPEVVAPRGTSIVLENSSMTPVCLYLVADGGRVTYLGRAIAGETIRPSLRNLGLRDGASYQLAVIPVEVGEPSPTMAVLERAAERSPVAPLANLVEFRWRATEAHLEGTHLAARDGADR